jgi:hypothetical protein
MLAVKLAWKAKRGRKKGTLKEIVRLLLMLGINVA